MGWSAAVLARAGVTPNAISVAGVVFAVLGGGLLAVTGLEAHADWASCAVLLGAAAGIQMRLVCNLLDGMVAIEGGRRTSAGPLYNEAPDRVSDAALLIGAGLAAGSSLSAGLLAALAAVLTAYVRELGHASGAGCDYSGPMAKQHRMALMTAVCGATALSPAVRHWRWEGIGARVVTLGESGSAGVWAVGLAVVTAGSLWTCVRRLRRAAAVLADRKGAS